MYSKAATKFENGKQRIIWNTSMAHYLAHAYILDHFEPFTKEGTWYSASHTSFHRLARSVARTKALKEAVGFMWDYADFNINHTVMAQVMLFSSLLEVIKSRLDGDAAVVANVINILTLLTKWVNRAKANAFLHDPETGYIQQALRSLASGERATSFVNTFLSRAYRLLHDRTSLRLFGHTLFLPASDHQGDDVFALVKSPIDATLAGALFLTMGYAGQLYKISCNYEPTGEYLRLQYDATGWGGYPIRSSMGMFSGEYFDDTSPDPPARSVAIFNQYQKVKGRGGALEPHIIDLLISRNAALVYSENGKKIRVTTPTQLALIPRALGGLGAQPAQAYQVKGVVADQAPTTNWEYLPPDAEQPETPLMAFGIPSGEGKTTLAQLYPGLFLDHDQLLNEYEVPPQSQINARNTYLKRVALNNPKRRFF